jgi:hypothetical protein
MVGVALDQEEPNVLAQGDPDRILSPILAEQEPSHRAGCAVTIATRLLPRQESLAPFHTAPLAR